jgi:hypothetical protein
MGKRPEDLPLDDAPLRRAQPIDPRSTDWYQFVQEIEELLASGSYDWASDTLQGIAQSVEQYQTVTEGQRRAVANVKAARGRSEGVRGRRYEGFRRR